jgi:hypothetical protein
MYNIQEVPEHTGGPMVMAICKTWREYKAIVLWKLSSTVLVEFDI